MRNVDISQLLLDAALKLLQGDAHELYRFPVFEPQQVLERLLDYLLEAIPRTLTVPRCFSVPVSLTGGLSICCASFCATTAAIKCFATESFGD